METWELLARECIRDTVARYNHAGDTGRFDDDGRVLRAGR